MGDIGILKQLLVLVVLGEQRKPLEDGLRFLLVNLLITAKECAKAVCVLAHSEIHKAMGKGTKKLAKERAEQRAKRWLDSIANNFTTPTDTIKDSRK